MKKIIIIGIAIILLTVGISGCIYNEKHTSNEEEIIGVIEGVEIINNNLILYFKKENYTYARPMIFREGYDVYDYAWCKLSIGDKVYLFYIEHITTRDDGLYEFWLEYQAIENVYEPRE